MKPYDFLVQHVSWTEILTEAGFTNISNDEWTSKPCAAEPNCVVRHSGDEAGMLVVFSPLVLPGAGRSIVDSGSRAVAKVDFIAWQWFGGDQGEAMNSWVKPRFAEFVGKQAGEWSVGRHFFLPHQRAGVVVGRFTSTDGTEWVAWDGGAGGSPNVDALAELIGVGVLCTEEETTTVAVAKLLGQAMRGGGYEDHRAATAAMALWLSGQDPATPFPDNETVGAILVQARAGWRHLEDGEC